MWCLWWYNTTCADCAGVPNGDAELDDCGVCNGGNADDLGCGCFEAGPSGCDNACGSDLEQKINGVIKYMPVTNKLQETKPEA